MLLVRQKGVALILVLVIVAIASVLAASYLSRQQLSIKRAGHQIFTDQSYFYALATEEWAKVILENDFTDGKVDSLDEVWAVSLPFIDIEGGFLSAGLTDLQGRLNINNLFLEGKLNPLARQRIQRLLALHEAPAEMIEAITDWLDSDRDPSGFGGAEDDYYSRLEQPYLAPNQPMSGISEMRLLRGMQDKLYQAIAPLLTALPSGVELNVNTASKETLKALNLPDGVIDGVISERESKAFEGATDFVTRLNLNEAEFDKAGLTVGSQYFVLNSVVVIAEVSYAQESLIHRDSKGKCRVLRRWRLPYVQTPDLDTSDDEAD